MTDRQFKELMRKFQAQKDERTTQVAGTNLTFFSLLGIAFIILKLTGQITWSWWLVTLPLWGPYAVAFALMLVVLIVMAVVGLFAHFF